MSEEEKSYESFADIESEAQEEISKKEIRVAAPPEEKKTEEKPQLKAKQPWLSFKQVNFSRDFYYLRRHPFWIVMNILLVLFLCFFLLLYANYLDKLKYEELIAYVAKEHKLPPDFKGEVPKEAEELMHHYHIREQQIQESKKLVKDDPRINEPVMGDFYPEVLSNDDVLLILQAQNIGLVTRSGAVKTELMNLSGLNLTQVSFLEMNNFERSDLRYTNFEGISQDHMIFRAASLQYAQFVDAQIPKANFTRARLDSANFFSASAPESIFNGAIAPRSLFSRTKLTDCNFDESLFKLAEFNDANLAGSTAKYSRFEAASFRNANLEGVNFKGAHLAGASFVEANLRGVNFSNANLDGANFEGADIAGANFAGTELNQANFYKVKNATEEQFKSSKTKIGINNIPDYVFPKQRSFRTRFKAPNTPY